MTMLRYVHRPLGQGVAGGGDLVASHAVALHSPGLLSRFLQRKGRELKMEMGGAGTEMHGAD